MGLTILACALPLGSGEQPSSPDQVATIVAQTLQAVTPAATEISNPSEAWLPHSFYSLGRDAAGHTQVFRIDRDGKT